MTILGHPTTNFSASEQGLFSPSEIQRLMRIEYERAIRYEYPIALMMLDVDRLEYLHDLYGYESKQEILQAVINLLRTVTRASDSLGCLVDDRLMAIFPHVTEKGAGAIAGRLLRGIRKLEFRSDGRKLRATLSIGIAITDGKEAETFDKFSLTAEAGLAFALESGGDRYVRRETAEELIQELRHDLEVEEASLAVEHERTAQERVAKATLTALPVAPQVPPVDDEFAENKVDELFASLPEGELDRAELKERLVALAQACMQVSRDQTISQLGAEHADQVDVLERRVSKLKEVLDQTEAELKRVAKMKQVDLGVASVYKTVQGLAYDDQDFERKQEMLTILFESNKDLQEKIRKIRGDS